MTGQELRFRNLWPELLAESAGGVNSLTESDYVNFL